MESQSPDEQDGGFGSRAEEIFARALEISGAEERKQFLADACGGDSELHLEVERLLNDADQADALYGIPDEGEVSAATPVDGASVSEIEGDHVGPYILRQKIGEGGFGIVWMAEQSEPISRMVALKVVKAGMDTKQVLARFEAERQALAVLDHPNIARVIDAGATASGRPYFAMDLVRGMPITEFCREQNYGTEQSLELFRDVCSAISHAHQKGIIHRDLKPSNVMVTLIADKPVAKVIDFGIAKATQSKLTDKTLFTRFEQFLGTPVYMSPEQAAMSGLDIDTRSDVYGLGVLLYELLTGSPPFEMEALVSAGYDEMRRIIREDEPPKPSTKLTETRKSARAGSKLRAPQSAISHELDWIVMKAIDKDRTRRYETANAFAADINRYLGDEPVEAAAPSILYKFRKFARRNKVVFGFTTAIALVLVAATVVSVGLAMRAVKAEGLSSQRFDEAETAKSAAETAREEQRMLFARSDDHTGDSYANQGDARLAAAHWARSLQAEPNNAALVDRLFNYFAYEHVPEYAFPEIDLGGKLLRHCVASADGSVVVTGVVQDDSPLTLFRAWSPDGKKLFERSQRVREMGGVDIRPDGRQLAIANHSQGVAEIINLPSGDKLRQFPQNKASLVQYSQDGRRLRVGAFVEGSGASNSLHTIWDVDTGELLETIRGGTGMSVWSSDEAQMLVGYLSDELTDDRGLRLVDIPTGEYEYFYHSDQYIATMFSADGSRFLARGEQVPWLIWNIKGRLVESAAAKYSGAVPSDPPRYGGDDTLRSLTAVGFTPDRQQILMAGPDLMIRLWDAADAEAMGEQRIERFVMGLFSPPQFSRDGRRAMIPTRDGYAYCATFEDADYTTLPDFEARPIHEAYAFLASSGELRPLLLPAADVTCAAVHPQNTTILLGIADGRIFTIDLTTGEPKGVPIEIAGEVESVAFNADGSQGTARSSFGNSIQWELSAPSKPRLVESQTNATPYIERDDSIRTGTPDGAFVATAKDQAIKVENAVDLDLKTGAQVLSLTFNSDGGLLAAGTAAGLINLWHMPSGDPAPGVEIRGDGRCASVVFSPNDRLLATVFSGGTASYAQVWDVRSGRAITGKLMTGDELSQAAFVDDGNRLVVWPQRSIGGAEGIAAIWDIVVSGGSAAPEWLAGVTKSFGGYRLDENSLPVPVGERSNSTENVLSDVAHGRAGLFFKWLGEFPGTRSDSPFRPQVTDAYVDYLIAQPDSGLLKEAVRLRPDDARAIARRGIYRLIARSPTPGLRALAKADLIRAKLFAPEDPEIAWYHAIYQESHGEPEEVEAAYAHARSLGPLNLSQLSAIIAVQDRYSTRATTRRELHDRGLTLAQENNDQDLVKHLLAKRFLQSVADGTYASTLEDWDAMKEWESQPSSIHLPELQTALLKATGGEADRLEGEGRSEEALALLRRVGVFAALSDSLTRTANASDEALSILVKMKEFVNLTDPPSDAFPGDVPWKYLDDGSDQGTAWRAPEFDDATWKAGRAKFGFGNDGEVTVLTKGHLTYYFRHRFNLAEEEIPAAAFLDLVHDDGAVVYVNGTQVLRTYMPRGEITYNTWASKVAEDSDSGELLFHRYAISPGALKTGLNVVAAEIHQASPVSSDLGFELKLLLSKNLPAAGLSDSLRREGPDSLRESAIALVPRSLRSAARELLALAMVKGEPEDPDSVSQSRWAQVVRFLSLIGLHHEILPLADRRISSLRGSFDPVDVAEATRWLRRKQPALRALRRSPLEIASIVKDIVRIPPRDPSMSPKQIDLTRYYNASMYDHRGWAPNYTFAHLRFLPALFEPLHGVHFDFRGLIQLESGPLPGQVTSTGNVGTANETFGNSKPYPQKVEGILIGQRSTAIHFLMSCAVGIEEPGTEVAKLVMHFDDGTPNDLPVRFGEHVHDFGQEDGVPGDKVGFRATHPDYGGLVQLSELIWKNPHPEKTISHIDFVSTLKAAAPFLIGITLE